MLVLPLSISTLFHLVPLSFFLVTGETIFFINYVSFLHIPAPSIFLFRPFMALLVFYFSRPFYNPNEVAIRFSCHFLFTYIARLFTFTCPPCAPQSLASIVCPPPIPEAINSMARCYLQICVECPTQHWTILYYFMSEYLSLWPTHWTLLHLHRFHFPWVCPCLAYSKNYL